MSSGVNIVGDATKAVGTGVVQGTKVMSVRCLNNVEAELLCHQAVGTGVVTGTKAVGSGVAAVGTGMS